MKSTSGTASLVLQSLWVEQALLTAEKRGHEDGAMEATTVCNGLLKKAKEEGRQEERNRVAKILLKDNCFKCGKEVPKPEDSPKDRKRWVDKCEGCKK